MAEVRGHKSRWFQKLGMNLAVLVALILLIAVGYTCDRMFVRSKSMNREGLINSVRINQIKIVSQKLATSDAAFLRSVVAKSNASILQYRDTQVELQDQLSATLRAFSTDPELSIVMDKIKEDIDHEIGMMDGFVANGASPEESFIVGVQVRSTLAKLEETGEHLESRWQNLLLESNQNEKSTTTLIATGIGSAFLIVLINTIYMNVDRSRREEIEAELRRAEVVARAATQSKSEFLANMSHEIRTPINAIIGLTDLVAETNLDAHQADLIATVSASSGVLLALIEGILDFSKIEAGKLEIEKTEFDLEHLVNTQIKIMSGRAALKKIELTSSVDRSLAQSYVGDPLRIGQVILNLLGNAVKFTNAEGAIRLSVVPSAHRDGFRVEVRDNGIGMDEATQARLFKSFAQADSSTSRKYGGTGLGLAISSRLVDLMDGTIGVVSEAGSGSTFWFELRLPSVLTPTITPAKAEMAISAKQIAESANRSGRNTVLVAEDSSVNQKVIRLQLEKMGWAVHLVSNGKEAVKAALSGQQYEIVFMDCQMPEMDGYEATRLIRRSELQLDTHLPIIALTANAMRGDQENCLAAGMDDYLAKPAKTKELQRILEQWTGLPKKAKLDSAA